MKSTKSESESESGGDGPREGKERKGKDERSRSIESNRTSAVETVLLYTDTKICRHVHTVYTYIVHVGTYSTRSLGST